jgi:hypothetical protein
VGVRSTPLPRPLGVIQLALIVHFVIHIRFAFKCQYAFDLFTSSLWLCGSYYCPSPVYPHPHLPQSAPCHLSKTSRSFSFPLLFAWIVWTHLVSRRRRKGRRAKVRNLFLNVVRERDLILLTLLTICFVAYVDSALGFRCIDNRRWCQLRSIHESFRLSYW